MTSVIMAVSAMSDGAGIGIAVTRPNLSPLALSKTRRLRWDTSRQLGSESSDVGGFQTALELVDPSWPHFFGERRVDVVSRYENRASE